MSQRSVSFAKWHRHLNAINPPMSLRYWLSLQHSLTTCLQDHSRQFRVQRLKQSHEPCLKDEFDQIYLARRRITPIREVLLYCDNRPVIFAHTAVTSSAIAYNWPAFRSLGNNSLGASLFVDPHIRRSKLQFSRINPSHLLAKRVRAALPDLGEASPFFARRCLFQRKRGAMLVTEIFLPEIINLRLRHT